MRLIRYIKRDPKRLKYRTEALLAEPGFPAKVLNIRNKWKIHQGSQISEFLFDTQFDKAITKLMRSYKLHENWRDWLYIYTITLSSSSNFDPDAAIIEEHFREEADLLTKEKKYYIRVFSHTSIDDAKRAWRIINKLRSAKYKRLRTTDISNRNLDIYRMANRGKSIIEIGRVPQDKHLDLGNIKNIVSKTKRKLGITRKRKLKTGEVSLKELLK